MKKILHVVVALMLSSVTWSQKELVNIYSSFSEMYGGMEDSGVSRTESYYFKAFATIEIRGILYNGEKIILQKGDTLIINVGIYTPYGNNEVIQEDPDNMTVKQTEIIPENRFKLMKVRRIIYANVQYPYIWPGTIEYIYKKKTYTSKIKEGFDNGFTGYAP